MNSPNDHNASKKRRRYYFEQTQGVALAVMFVVSTGVAFYLGILTGENIQNAVDKKPLARMAVNAPLGNEPAVDSTPETNAEIAPAKDAVDGKAAPVAVKPEVPDASPASRPTSSPAQNGTTHGEQPWSVQIAATADKNVADTTAQRLTAKGYKGYVVEGEVNGKTWYRVRVGRLAARDEAENLRQLLDSKEGLHGAFLARD